jgi:hypothetical protein
MGWRIHERPELWWRLSRNSKLAGTMHTCKWREGRDVFAQLRGPSRHERRRFLTNLWGMLPWVEGSLWHRLGLVRHLDMEACYAYVGAEIYHPLTVLS